MSYTWRYRVKQVWECSQKNEAHPNVESPDGVRYTAVLCIGCAKEYPTRHDIAENWTKWNMVLAKGPK